jgi:hypothetical protein
MERDVTKHKNNNKRIKIPPGKTIFVGWFEKC